MEGSININLDVDLEKFVPAFVDGIMYEVSGTSADENIYDSAVSFVLAIDKEIADIDFTEKLIKRLLGSLVDDFTEKTDLVTLTEDLIGLMEARLQQMQK